MSDGLREPEPAHPCVMVRSDLGSNTRTRDAAEADVRLRKRAQGTAEEGARRLRTAGIPADPLVVERNGSIARTVLEVAGTVNAEVIIVGTRGRGSAKSTLLGSVSHDLIQHADRAVAIVPPAALVRRRELRLSQA